MVAIGALVVWMGYGIFYYGLDQIRGGNNGLLDLMVPGRYKNMTPDASSQGGNPGGGIVSGNTPIIGPDVRIAQSAGSSIGSADLKIASSSGSFVGNALKTLFGI